MFHVHLSSLRKGASVPSVSMGVQVKNLEVPGEARNSRSKSVLSERLAFDGVARNVKCKQMDKTLR